MSQQPLTMHQLKQILQLKHDGVPIREIARHTGISRNSIKKYLLRLHADSSALPDRYSGDGTPSFWSMVTPV